MDLSEFDVKALLQDKNKTFSDKVKLFYQVISEARRQKLYLYFRTTAGPSENHIQAVSLETGVPKEMIMLASNNYLGLTTHPELKERTKAAIDTWGIGMAGPASLNGYTTLHQELEARLARFKKTEAAILFPSGYSANIGALTAILGNDDFFVGDELNHASLIDGARYSKAKRLVFRHNDVSDLEKCLKEVENLPGQKLVAVDGVYSMDGEIAPLREIVDTCKKYGAMLFVDDSHGSGAVGAKGHGSLEACGVEGEVDVVMGTFSKAFGCYGGFVAGSKELVNWLRHFARAGMFTATVSPMTVAACLAGLDVIENNPELVQKLHKNMNYVRGRLAGIGFKLMGADTPIIPLLIGDLAKGYAIVKEAYESGVFLSLIEFPAVPQGTERIRLTVMATHTQEDLDTTINLLEKLSRKYGVLI